MVKYQSTIFTYSRLTIELKKLDFLTYAPILVDDFFLNDSKLGRQGNLKISLNQSRKVLFITI